MALYFSLCFMTDALLSVLSYTWLVLGLPALSCLLILFTVGGEWRNPGISRKSLGKKKTPCFVTCLQHYAVKQSALLHENPFFVSFHLPDLLPLKCDVCGEVFCKDHICYDEHSCSSACKAVSSWVWVSEHHCRSPSHAGALLWASTCGFYESRWKNHGTAANDAAELQLYRSTAFLSSLLDCLSSR